MNWFDYMKSPAVWRGGAYLIFWYTVNVTTVISNRWIFQKMDFTFPFALTAIHMLCGWLLSWLVLDVFKWLPKLILPNEGKNRMPLLGLIFAANIVLGNVSLRWIPVSFMQTIKASVPFFTVIGQTLFIGKRFSVPVLLAVIPICGGVILASSFEASFHLGGFLAALMASITTALQTILISWLLGGGRLDSVNLVNKVSPYASLLMVLSSLILELSGILEAITLGIIDITTIFVLLASGCVAFLLNVSTFLAIHNTSALTFNVAGNFKVILSITLSVMIFQNELTALAAMGCFVTLMGTAGYNYIGYKEKKRESEAELRKMEGISTK